ncbi:MAG TPA: hypothetical protein VEH06_04365 [Candidatus Bathyarchaeia archaeon]|nr:hypothetical protein [Candidatus Bathyarchaeia archaeon]
MRYKVQCFFAWKAKQKKGEALSRKVGITRDDRRRNSVSHGGAVQENAQP